MTPPAVERPLSARNVIARLVDMERELLGNATASDEYMAEVCHHAARAIEVLEKENAALTIQKAGLEGFLIEYGARAEAAEHKAEAAQGVVEAAQEVVKWAHRDSQEGGILTPQLVDRLVALQDRLTAYQDTPEG